MKNLAKRITAAALSLVCLAQLPVISDTNTTAEAASVRTDSSGRLMEYLDRGVSAVSTGNSVFVSWRSLEGDPASATFNVYRTTDGTTTKLNANPLTGGTNYTDTTADLTKDNTYTVKMVVGGVEQDTDGSGTLSANSTAGCTIIPIQAGGTIHFVWVGDFNGDGAYDYLVDRCADDQQKLEAYLNDGTYLWTLNLGYNSENKNNIEPGASTIDVGMWDGATVYDIDCDGYAEVMVRIADGVTFGDGKKYTNSDTDAQVIAVVDGMTGALQDTAPVPDDKSEAGPKACMMEIGYLDGVKPSLICWVKNRNDDKSFNSYNVAYTYENDRFVQQWKAGAYGAEAHQIRVADVDYDGKDEVLHQGYCLNSDGSLRYTIPDVVHGDRWYVGAFTPGNVGNEMMGYGIQQENPSGLLEYFYNASTGEILWKNATTDGTTYDVGRGNVGDIDPTHAGWECYSFQGVYSNDGTKLTANYPYPVIGLWWDGDLLTESFNDSKIEKWNYETETVSRLATTWKITDCTNSDRGAPMFYGDILGDWREELVLTSYDFSKLVIISTTIPTDVRNECLAQDPCYRNCMTAKGYYQSHMLDYYLGSDMEQLLPASSFNTAYSYTIRNANSGKYLAVDGRTAANGTNVLQSAEAQKWTLEDAGNGYYKICSEVGDGKTYLLDVDYGKTDDGTNIGIYENTDATAQQFKFVDNGDGTYTIVTNVSKDKSCLGVTNMSMDESANVVEWTSNGSTDQKWIVEVKIDAIQGTLIKDLQVKDLDNYTDWMLAENVQNGTLVYGDREVTYTNLPDTLVGAEIIQTACDSKNATGDIAEFVAGADMTVYVALDNRVTTVPAWLSDWEKTDMTAENSNGVTYLIYAKAVTEGTSVTLGTNGQVASCVGYTVFASASAKTIRGDVNADGVLSVADAVMLQKWLIGTPNATLTDWQAGDLCEDGKIDAFDLCVMKRELLLQ